MESASGIVALAVFFLWLGFYVPHRVRHRQQLLEARTEDRFSGSLRVLAVAGPGIGLLDGPGTALGGVAAITAGPTDGPIGGRRALLGPAGGGAHEQDRSDGRTHEEEGLHAMESTVSTSPPRGAPPRPAASRLTLLERRAAAARRRLALTVVLLLASVAVWAVVALGYLPWWAGVLPTALLGLVLVLGRRAVLAAKRTDAAWLAERRATARAARGVVLGAPPAPRGARPRVTGRAVHASQVSTQMIPRVTPKDLARANAAATSASGASTGTATARERVTAASATADERSGSEEADSPGPSVREPAEARPAAVPAVPAVPVVARPGDETAEHVASGRAWDPVPVPPPTYTMKPTAPRREPAPLTADDVAPPARQGATEAGAAPVTTTRVEGAPSGTGEDVAGAPEPADGDERRPRTETLGLDLNEILARRRAAGQ